MAVRRAVIDIGTNSVKLLVADVEPSSVRSVFEESEQTRLGQGFYESHRLQPENILHTAKAVAAYVQVARQHEATSVRLIATSAARDAVNQQELLSTIEHAAGLPVEVISGEQEALWVYRGVRSDERLAGERLLILDVGGGSSEFILGDSGQPEFSNSFPIGSVRLIERLKPSDPPSPGQLAECRSAIAAFFAEQVHPMIGPIMASKNKPVRVVGTGGAATILARMEYSLRSYERQLIDGARISRQSVERWVELVWSMPLAERRGIIGLPKKRADVILTGAAIYEAVLREFNFAEVIASTRGLRFAAVMHADEPVTAPR